MKQSKKVYPLNISKIKSKVDFNKINNNDGDEKLDIVDLLLQDVENDINIIKDYNNSTPIKIKNISNNKNNTENDIKLSHQIQADEYDSREMLQQLRTQYDILTKQIQEYKNRNNRTMERIKESDSKIIDLETKIEELEDENETLKIGISSDMPLKDFSFKSKSRTKKMQSQHNQDLNKRNEALRKVLLQGDNEDAELTITVRSLLNQPNVFYAIQDVIAYFLPFRDDLKKIHARFGSSIVAYFNFVRSLFIESFLIAIAMLVFAIVHLNVMAKNHAKDYLVGSGFLPQFMIFSSFIPQEANTYSSFVIITILCTLFILTYKFLLEHKHTITVEVIEADKIVSFSKEVLCAWDCSSYTASAVETETGKLQNTYLLLLEESRSEGIRKARSNNEIFITTVRRIFGMFLFIVVISASFTAIISITIRNNEINTAVTSLPGLAPFKAVTNFFVPICLSMINAIVPELLKIINDLEKWDSAKNELQMLLLRMYISNTLNTVIVALSYLLLMDPFLFAQKDAITLRNNLQVKLSNTFSCRLDQASDGLFFLVFGTWLTNLFGLTAYPIFLYVYAQLTKIPWKKPTLDVSNLMVTKLSFIGLIVVSFPFAPLSMVFVPFYLYIDFKFEKYFMRKLYLKPKRPFSGQAAGLLFASLHLLTFFIAGLTVSGYMITTHTMAKSCDIQDDYVGLCLDSVDLTTDLCTTDPSSKYYHTYGKSDNYPSFICSNSCGPFINERSIGAVFVDHILGTAGIGGLWNALFVEPYIAWIIIIGLFIRVFMLINSYEVLKFASINKDRNYDAQIQSSELERKKQEKMILKLKSIEESYNEETTLFENIGISGENISRKLVTSNQNNSTSMKNIKNNNNNKNNNNSDEEEDISEWDNNSVRNASNNSNIVEREVNYIPTYDDDEDDS